MIKTTRSLKIFGVSSLALAFAANAFAWGLGVTADEALNSVGESYYAYNFKPSADKLAALPTLSQDSANPSCSAFYTPFVERGTLRIHVSFGYLDDSTKQSYEADGFNFGMNVALDGAFYHAFVEGLKKSCHGAERSCGFSENLPGQLTKTIKSPDGREVQVILNTDSASLTGLNQVNTVDRASEQEARSESVRQGFLEALQTDDVVFYIGHSRNGGGPDFYPPRLLPNLTPDYRGYYEVKRPGYHDMLSAIQSRSSTLPMLGMFSCASEFWFGAGLEHLTPRTGFVLTPSDMFVSMSEVFAASVATLDSVLRFQCYDGMAEEIQSVRSIPDYNVYVRNLLSDEHPVNTHSRLTAAPVD